MKLRNAIIFLIVSTAAIFLTDIGMMIYNSVKYGHQQNFTLNILLYSCYELIPASVIVCCIAVSRSNVQLRKIGAIVLAVGGICWFSYNIYIIYTFTRDTRFTVYNTWWRFIVDIVISAHTLAMGAFGLAMIAARPRWIKTAAWTLVSISVVCCLNRSITMVSLFFKSSYLREDLSNLYLVVSMVVYIVYHTALISLMLAMMRTGISQAQAAAPVYEDDELLDLRKEIHPAPVASGTVPSIIDWFSDLLVIMIPVAGSIFLIWRGFSNRDRHRRNWAAASIFLSIIGSLLSLYFYAAVFGRLFKPENVLLTGLCYVVLMLSVWGGMMVRIRDDRHDHAEETEEVTTVWGWVGNLLIVAIPVVGLIMLIDWAASREYDNPKRNWSRAMLIRMIFTLLMWAFIYVEMRETLGRFYY